MPDLSIIIVSYNTKDLTSASIESIFQSNKKSPFSFEIIVVDNGSTDGSIEELTKYEKQNANFKLIKSIENLGFGKANNVGLKAAQGKYILYLNSDTDVSGADFQELLRYMDEHTHIGVLTVKVVLSDGTIDPASHRGFPTLWRAFTYYSKLEKLTQNIPYLNRFFGGYHLTHLDRNTVHEIDSPTGAFYLTRRKLMEELHGFDEDFFMYGEDLDLSFRVKQKGYKIIFYPLQTILHLKGQSGRGGKNVITKKKTNKYFKEAMWIYFKKHYGQSWY